MQFGSFHGGLPRMDFGPIPKSRLWKLVHDKRWTYVGIADERVFCGIALVSLSYAATAILFILDRASGEMLVDRSVIGPASALAFEDRGDGDRIASFKLGRTRVRLGSKEVLIDIVDDKRGGQPAHILARPTGPGPAALSAIVPIEGGYANATEKRLVEVTGEVVAAGRRYLLGGKRPALAAYDHTAGYLARHTAWRWALGLGYDATGQTRVAFNLVEGFVGEAECGGWIDDELVPFGEGRFEFDEQRPQQPWRIHTTCGALDLVFEPAAVHAEHKDLLLVRSKFIQPVGAFRGTLRLPAAAGRSERVIRLENLPGVTEHQDVLW